MQKLNYINLLTISLKETRPKISLIFPHFTHRIWKNYIKTQRSIMYLLGLMSDELVELNFRSLK